MRVRPLLVVPVLLALALWQDAAPALAASQPVALFTPDIVDGSASGARADSGPLGRDALASRLEQALKEKLQDRFDVRLAGHDARTDDGAFRKRRAGVLEATYTLTAVLTRIGRSAALDLVLSPVDGPGKGRTVVVTGTDAETPAPQNREIPFVYRRLVIEGSAKLKLAFFGDETVDRAAGRRRIPRPTGAIGRSRSIPGDVVSVAVGDTDRDGKDEVVAAYGDSIGVYGIEGDDITEKARISLPGGGVVRVDAADLTHNGIADIVAVRYAAGKAVSDVFEFDGTEYRRTASDIPYFLRAVDLGREGVVPVGQEADPATVFRGPVFRISLGLPGAAYRRGDALPLPDGIRIYSFTPLRYRGRTRFAVLGDDGRLSLLDENGARIGESAETVAGTDLFLKAPLATGPGANLVAIQSRLFAVDPDGDKDDEIVVMNNLVVPGGFFENIKVYANSEALCFAQGAETLDLAWRTPQIDGASRDAFIVGRHAGGPIRIGVATREPGKILGRYGEWRLLWLR